VRHGKAQNTSYYKNKLDFFYCTALVISKEHSFSYNQYTAILAFAFNKYIIYKFTVQKTTPGCVLT
jgi:hypothetical protein